MVRQGHSWGMGVATVEAARRQPSSKRRTARFPNRQAAQTCNLHSVLRSCFHFGRGCLAVSIPGPMMGSSGGPGGVCSKHVRELALRFRRFAEACACFWPIEHDGASATLPNLPHAKQADAGMAAKRNRQRLHRWKPNTLEHPIPNRCKYLADLCTETMWARA